MDIKSLITEFQNWDLRNLSKYADLLSTKTDDGQFFPPYIPFVGKNYEGYRILIYATAQNIPFSLNELSLRELYSKNFDKLVERLYYSCPGFERKYPENDLDFSEIAIAPYQGGVLPALAGVLIYSISQEKYSTFNEVQDHVAVSNYYKFSLHKKIDINPNHLESPEKYWELNICDENFGSWGSQGIEVAVKTWLSGGRVMVNQKTWYAHCFRTQGGDFGFPYVQHESEVQITKKKVWGLFFNGNFKQQKYPASWLVEKFSPVPGWSDEDIKKLKESEKTI